MDKKSYDKAVKTLKEAKEEGISIQGLATVSGIFVSIGAVAWWTFLMYLAITFGGIVVPVLMSLYVVNHFLIKVKQLRELYELVDSIDAAE